MTADRLQKIYPNGLRNLFEMASKIRGKKVISFGIGDLDVGMPTELINQIQIAAQDKNNHRYSSNWGIQELREGIQQYYSSFFSCNPNLENVLVTAGATEALFVTFFGLINPGDEVLLLDPVFRPIENCVLLSRGKSKHIQASPDFERVLENITENIGPSTKAIVANFPNNPSGEAISRSNMQSLVELCRDHDIYCVSDETYAQIRYDSEKPFTAYSFDYNKIITLGSFSKVFRMTGGRIGYVLADPEILQPLCRIHQYTSVCANTVYQKGLAGYLNQLSLVNKDLNEFIGLLRSRRDCFLKEIAKNDRLQLPYSPEGGFFLYPKIQDIKQPTLQFCETLLKEKQVVTVPGSEFSNEETGHIRLSYGSITEDEIKEGLVRIQEFLSKE